MEAKAVAIRGVVSLLFIFQLGSYAVGQNVGRPAVRGSAPAPEPPSHTQRPVVVDTTASVNPAILSASDVNTAIMNAAAAVSSPLVIAVTDRQGNILAVYRKANAPTTAIGNFSATVNANDLAVGLAHTGGFFSNDEAPLSSRTVRFISGIHFPPGVMYTGPADLYGIENTNRGCPLNATLLPGVSLPPSRTIDGTAPGLGIQTGKADVYDSQPFAVNPGGVPLFKNGIVVGGIGVVGPTPAISEYAGVVAAISPPFAINPPSPGVVVIGGIALPFVNQTTPPEGPGVADGSYLVGPMASPAPDPVGDLIAEHAGTGGLTLSDVQTIVQQAIATANITRAAIRLPLGSPAKMVISVADIDGSFLAIYRMFDATIFSVDVATAKARNVVYLSGNPGNDLPGVPPGTAVTNRAIYFASEPFYPPGIDYTQPGPFFPLYLKDTANPCTQGSQPANPNQSGIVFFPGSVPLYKNGVLVGGLGISGDGVNQDDFVTAGGANGYMAPTNIRIDQLIVDGLRIPYQKFDRNPTIP